MNALVRDSSSAAAGALASKDNVTVMQGDVYQFATLPKAAAGCDALICATGAKDIKNPLGPYEVVRWIFNALSSSADASFSC